MSAALLPVPDHALPVRSAPPFPVVRTRAEALRAAADLLVRQFGVASRPQLIACGMTGRQIERRMAVGSLNRIARGVYLLPSMPGSWEQRAIAAVLATSLRHYPGALSHESAAASWGLPGYERRGTIWVTADPGDRHPNPFAEMTRAIDLLPEDVVDGPLGVPTTSIVRTVLDLAIRTARPTQISALLASALIDDRVHLDALSDRVAMMGGRPGIVGVRRALRAELKNRRRDLRREERRVQARERRRARRLAEAAQRDAA